MTTLPQTTSIQLPRPVNPGAAITPAHAIAPAGPLPPPQMTGADVMRVLRTNIWLIIGTLIASVIIGVALNFYLDSFHARYTAVALVQVQTNRRLPSVTDRPTDTGEEQTPLIVEQRTQASLLTSDALFAKVLQNPNYDIRKTKWFQDFDGDIAEAKEDLEEKFLAVPIPDTKLIRVTMTYKVPKDCATIVSDIVNQHLEDQRKIASDKTVERSQYLRNLLIRWENRIKELKQETSLKAAQLQLDGFGRPGGLSQKESELQQYITERLKLESIANASQNAYESAQQQYQKGEIPSAVEMMVEENGTVQRLVMMLHDYDIRLRAMELQRNQGPDSRAYKELKAQRDATQAQLEEVRAEERAKSTVMYLETLASRAQQSKSELEALNKQIDKVRNDLAEMTGTLSDYLTKKDEEEGFIELRNRVRDQLDVINQQLQQIDLNTVSWANRPEIPDTPSFPKLPYTLAATITLGLLLSLGIAFLREITDTTVRSPRDIARVGQLNLLGMIPHEDDDPQVAGVPLPAVIYSAPTSMMAEQFRQVRTRLQHAASLDTTRSILITSPSPGDGKSTVACNLAAGLALNGRRILLVDANFRRPELHKIFAAKSDVGFANVLNSIEAFESAIQQTKVPNLDLMVAGPKPANATELLESQLLIDFIERALEEYDHVVFDSGPMLFVSETVALAPRVDGVITVVRASTNTRGLLQRMRDALRQLKAEHLGVVLNGVRSASGGYYARNIKTYYEYQNGAVTTAQAS
ncbi:polysaccharide biosynthesis tyrosine autokinase [Fontivita pretiosa]|uniref:polysaccharide biosynthesis tyrosine autokinase n=1 Tax=Fontivita pretiosa TaxID=2989684 RepID=UPI003D16D894